MTIDSLSEVEARKRLPVDVSLVLEEIDRERARIAKGPFANQGGLLRITDSQYRIMREHILGSAGHGTS